MIPNQLPNQFVLIAMLRGFELMFFNGFVTWPVVVTLFMSVWEFFADMAGDVAVVEAVA